MSSLLLNLQKSRGVRAFMTPTRTKVYALTGWANSTSCWQTLQDATTHLPLEWHILPWQQALELAGLCEEIQGSKDRIILLGWSIGAMAALKIAVECHDTQDRLRLLLVGASARFVENETVTPAPYGGATKRTVNALKRQFKRDPEGCASNFWAGCFAPNKPPANGWGGGLSGSDKSTVLERGLEGLDFLVNYDLRPEISAVKQRVTLVHGEMDQVVAKSQAVWLARHLINCNGVYLPNVGHAIAEQRVQAELLRQLIEILEEMNHE